MSNPIQGKPAGAERGGGVVTPIRPEVTFDPRVSIPGADGQTLSPRDVDLLTEAGKPAGERRIKQAAFDALVASAPFKDI